MATTAEWQALANTLNALKTTRNNTPGFVGTGVANATTNIQSLETLINDINSKDSTKFSFYSYSSSIPEGEYYPTISVKIKLLQKKVVSGQYCSSHSTCNPHTLVSCNPNSSSCSCQSQCGHSCSCQSQCGYGSCGCQTDGCYSDSYCCDGNCSDSCCDGNCSCDDVCNYSSCSHCINTPCTHTCSCYNVCGCVFV